MTTEHELTMDEETRIRGLGAECAGAAIDAGGGDPFDADGGCLLSDSPQDRDWEWLRDQLGHRATEDEERAFRGGYRERMKPYIASITE